MYHNSADNNDGELVILFSLTLFMSSVLFRQIIPFLLGPVFLVLIKLASLLLAIFHLFAFRKKKIRKNELNFAFMLSIVLIPFFFKNAYYQDEQWLTYSTYIITIAYSIIISIVKIHDTTKRKIYKILVVFGITTSAMSWLEYVSIGTYSTIVKNIFPSNIAREIIYEFTARKNLCGLTSHYSYNAVFVAYSLMATLYLYRGNKSKKKYIILLFLTSTLLAIGKRGAILYLAISLVGASLIIYRIKLRTILKLIVMGAFMTIVFLLLSANIPEIRHTLERTIEKTNSSEDISSGRFNMNNEIARLYEENGRNPIGWGQYAKATNYFHPGLHNDYLQLYYEVGIIGEMMVLLPNFLILFVNIKRARKNDNIAKITLAYNIFFMLYAITGLPHYDPEMYSIYYITNALLYNGVNNEKKQRNNIYT